MIRSWAVQQAVYTILHSDSTLMALVTGIADEPEQDQIHPYVVIGETTAVPDDILSTTGAQETLTLHVWDKDAPISRTKQIMDRMIVLLHAKKFAVSGTQTVQTLTEFTEVTRDTDTLHGIVRVRVITFG